MEAQDLKIVGRSIPRVDVTSKLTGQALFGEDVKLPGPLLHGKILRSPHPHAIVKRIDTAAAEKLAGVKAVATAADLPDVRIGKNLKDEHYFASDKVRFVGDRVAAVAAVSREIAEEALRLIEVEYELLPALTNPIDAMRPDAPLVHPDLMNYQVVAAAQPEGGNVCSLNSLSRGDPEAGFAEAHQVFEQQYITEMQHQAYMEPHACLATYNPDNTYTVYTSTQGIFGMRNSVAEALGVPQNRVKVVGTEIGGGFGGKIVMKDEVAAATLSRKSGLPVRIVMTRAEDFMCGNPRAGFYITIKTGVSKDMRMVARTMEIVLDGGAHAMGAALMCWALPQFAEGPYSIPNLRVTSRCVYTNKANSSAFRAPGGPQTNFAVESETERIATAMGWDALAFRRNNLMPEDHPNLAGTPMRSVNVEETLDAALEISGYDPAQTGLGPNRARGLALGNWNVGGMPTGTVLKMNDDGSANLITGVVDLTGVNTSLTQVVAEALQLPVEKVTVKSLDTDSAPHAAQSAGSQTLKSMGTAAVQAAQEVKQQLFELAVEELDATPDNMELAEGEVRVQGSPERTVAVRKLLAKHMANSGPVVGKGGTGAFSRMPSFCAHIADVDVDPETGRVTLLRYCASQDVGVAINPVICIGQVQGGVAQGVGMALSEGLTYQDGQPQNTGFLDYKVPSALDLPMIETKLVEKPAVEGPFGAKGIGEPPCVPVPAAIANAIYNAVGVRVTSLPINPEKLRRAIKAKKEGQASS
ncbi:MAG: xanthine dehydrogenase family protein molybdopterin-binding subunit [SAR324 cluster bacterium]|nr:xanthine dehydrogenase family protein molybdopterin-binding subunit [SAR324 cluster bacterium]